MTVLCAALAASITTSLAATFTDVTNGLVGFYPLDYLNPDNVSTPDLIGRRDLILSPATTAANIIASTRPGGAATNCFNLNQSGGATVLYYPSTGMDALTGVGDFLPICNQRTYTLNFWINLNGSAVGNDLRFFGEADNTGSQSAPLWLIGTKQSGQPPTRAYFLLRDNTSAITTDLLIPDDGTIQSPAMAQRVQATHNTSLPVLDGTWRMFTITRDTNGSYNVYVDGVLDTGPSQDGTQQVDFYGQNSVLEYIWVTNFYYTTNIYPAAGVSNPPPNGYVGWVFPGMYKSGSTAFGGFKRGGITGGAACQIDDIGMWNRALSVDEIEFVRTNGLPGIALNTNFISIVSFKADFGEAGQGDQVGLSWTVLGASTGPGGVTISGVGDVTAFGASGSTNVTLTDVKTYTFTLTASNGFVANKTASVSVKAFPGVASDWHLIQRFDGLFSDTTAGINGNGWVSALSDFAGNKDRWNVLSTTNASLGISMPGLNRILAPRTGYNPNAGSVTGFDSKGAMAYGLLNSLTMPPGRSNTLFFRFALKDPGVNTGLISDLDCGIGLSDRNLIGPLTGVAGPGNAGNIGPFLSIIRSGGGLFAGGPIDIVARDYSGTATTNSYSYTNSVDPNGLQTNVNYYVWMDVQNNNTHAVTNLIDSTTNTVEEAVFSVWLQKQGEASRTLLFSGFKGNRDYVGFDPIADNPTPYLNKVFVSIADEDITTAAAGAYLATNMIAVDDFYLSKNGYSSTIPKLFDLRSIVRGASTATITWDSLGSIYQTNTYTVQRKFLLTDASWTTLTNGMPSGGDTTTFTDNTVGSSSTAFYRIVWP